MKNISKLFTKFVSALSVVVMTMTNIGSLSVKSTSSYDEPDFKEFAERVIVLVNEARVEAGLNPIYAVPYLCDVAKIRSEECIENFSHSRANGGSFIQVVDYDITPWSMAAENIACGMNTPEATFEQWKNSPKHWRQL